MVHYQATPDLVFDALGDPTRRGVLQRLGLGDATITELAEAFGMTLTGIRKHVRILETVGLVTTEKEGRTRTCRLGPRGLEAEQQWMADYQRRLAARYDRLGEVLGQIREER